MNDPIDLKTKKIIPKVENKFKKSLVLVISIKLFSFSLFFLLIKFDVMKKIREKTTRKDIKINGLNFLI